MTTTELDVALDEVALSLTRAVKRLVDRDNRMGNTPSEKTVSAIRELRQGLTSVVEARMLAGGDDATLRSLQETEREVHRLEYILKRVEDEARNRMKITTSLAGATAGFRTILQVAAEARDIDRQTD